MDEGCTQETAPSAWPTLRREVLVPLGDAFLIAMVIRTFFFQAFSIPTGSMEPTLHGVPQGGDRILVNKFVYGIRLPFTDFRPFRLRKPRPGDIVVFKTKGIRDTDETQDYVKRLVAVGGQSVLIKNGRLFLDGQETTLHLRTKEHRYYNTKDLPGSHMRYARGRTIVVPERCYFCLGDNSGSSADGRFWGFVPERNLLGRATVRWWPPVRMGILR